MHKVQISGTGLYTPKEKISNEELVQSFNKYVDEFNEINSEDIKNGKTQPLEKEKKTRGINGIINHVISIMIVINLKLFEIKFVCFNISISNLFSSKFNI